MSKKKIDSFRRSIKLKKSTPQADLEETSALLDLLFEANKQNNAQCARLLGISTPTWHRWTTQPPTEWYWPMVLRAAIKHTLSSIVAQRRFQGKKFQRSIMEALSKIPQNKDFEAELADMAYDIRGAELHLRTILAKKGMWWSELRLPANNGGYTQQTLRKAAKALKVQTRQEGYGADKDSYWRLPLEDED